MDVTLAGTLLNRALNDDQMGRVSIELSADGSQVGVGTIVIDDPSGSDDIAGGRQALVTEGVATISDGFIGAQDKGRGGNPGAPHREDIYQIQDANALFYGKRFVQRSRPAETDRARVLAFAGFDLSGIDTTWVLNTNTETLPAKKYTGSDWSELQSDVFEATGKLIFLHDKANGTGRCLHSHKETEGHACGITISDDPSAYNGTTVFDLANANRNKSAGALINDVYGRDQDGRVSIRTDATSIASHDADGLKHQAVIEFEATSQADLDLKTAAYLAENKREVEIYDGDIGPLDQTALLLIRQGDRITVTSQAVGLSAQVIRIAHMVLSPARDTSGKPVPGQWIAHLELNQAIRLGAGSNGGGGVSSTGGRIPSGSRPVTKNDLARDCGCPPFDEASCPFTTYDDMNRTNASAWGNVSSSPNPTWGGTKVSDASGGGIVFADSMVPTHGLMKLTHPSGTWNGSAEERVAGPGFWSNGDWKMTTSVDVKNTNMKDWHITAGLAIVGWGRTLLAGAPHLQVSYNGSSNFYPMPAANFDGAGFVDILLRKNGSTVTAIVAGVQLSVTSFDALGADDDLVFTIAGLAAVAGGAEAHFGPINVADCATVPKAGQTFKATETGDGSTTVFTAPYLFRAIRSVVVAGVDVTPDVTASDPDSEGRFTTYTFAHAPALSATIRVVLEGAGL